MPKHEAVHGQIVFTMDTALPAPRALRLLSQENLYEKDIPDEGWERDMFVFDWVVPSMHAKLQSTAGLQKREGEGSSEQGTFTAYRMRLPERTRLTCRAVLLLSAASYKSKTSVPEFSITDYLIKAHIRQHKSRPWLGPTHSPPPSLLWVTSWLHCASTSSLLWL